MPLIGIIYGMGVNKYTTFRNREREKAKHSLFLRDPKMFVTATIPSWYGDCDSIYISQSEEHKNSCDSNLFPNSHLSGSHILFSSFEYSDFVLVIYQCNIFSDQVFSRYIKKNEPICFIFS